MNLRQRLDLFVQVCDAVQHAHQKGVLHRNLKPSNILVANVDGRAITKVTDFGLAKALQSVPELLDAGVTTRIGQVLGTLKYMSPEQANLDDVDNDTRTDIYALGVMLYELLTGTTPLDDASIRGGALVKLLEIVRTNEPVKPSSRLLSSGQAKTLQQKADDQATSKKVTEARSTDIRRLRQALLGDLDWIAMKAIENDRRRRYQTASGFADDVRRFLTDQPMLARPPSFLYWMHKSIRRHRLAAASMALIVVCLGAATLGLAYGLNRSQALAQVERRARLLSESQREVELAGKRGGRHDIFMLTQVFGYEMKLISPVVAGMFEVPEIGERWRRQMIPQQASFKEFFLRPIPLLMYRFVRSQFLATADLSAAIEREGFEVCQELVAMYDNGQLMETTDFSTILYFIIGPFTENSIDTIKQRYPARVVGGLAYLAFKKAELRDNLKSEEAQRCMRAIAALKGMPPNMADEVKNHKSLAGVLPL